ncbi:hypothetical protein [Ornithinimicrobium sediminis]|uniref:hypothetical protein n=1 Tax=Ornithinimicrobium sediminis TaxID=2904603 RepID=UPI001E39392A|nr:hypothetical protein [Ornithinimicrobium sediminis]MCE0485648.1 hypothetical protein [Ornithinimicrobium sediminis]
MTRSTLTATTLAAALLLSACSGLSADEAATISGRTIGTAELQETTGQLNSIAAAPTEPANVLNELTRTDILDRVMAGTALEITDGEVTDLLRESGLSEPTDLTVDVARTRQYLALLQDPTTLQNPEAEDVLERLNEVTEADFEELGVEVNPRYGTWDPAQAVVVDEAPEWIAPVE